MKVTLGNRTYALKITTILELNKEMVGSESMCHILIPSGITVSCCHQVNISEQSGCLTSGFGV